MIPAVRRVLRCVPPLWIHRALLRNPRGSVRPCRRAITRIGTRCKRIGTIRAEPSHTQRDQPGHAGFLRRQLGPDYRADLDLIFANPDGTPLKPDSVSSAVSLRCRRLGLPKGASLHTLRHTHGSFLLADGVDLATVSERLGHSSVRVTADIYSHALRGRDQEAPRWDTSCACTADLARNQRGKLMARKKPRAEMTMKSNWKESGGVHCQGEFRALSPGPAASRSTPSSPGFGVKAPVFGFASGFTCPAARLVILFSNLQFGRFRVVALELELCHSF